MGKVDVLNQKPAISLKDRTNRKSENKRSWMILNGHYALCFKTYASFGFGALDENLNEDKPILSTTNM